MMADESTCVGREVPIVFGSIALINFAEIKVTDRRRVDNDQHYGGFGKGPTALR
jgi:hypothetical protein